MGIAIGDAPDVPSATSGSQARREEPFVDLNNGEPSRHGSPPSESPDSSEIVLIVGGELTVAALPRVWQEALDPLRRMPPASVKVDASQLVCRDSTCLALFAEIRRVVAQRGGRVSIVGLKPELQALLESAKLSDPLAPELHPPKPPGWITRLGEGTAHTLTELKSAVAFVGELCAAMGWAAFHPRQVRWRQFVLSCEKAGADAAPVVLLLGFLIGVMLAFQSAEQTERYGVRTVVPSVVAIAVTRELGPLITTLLLAGRTASAFAAELGTMKINQELSALRAMGLDPVRFLALPRVLAVLVVTPLLTAFCDLAGILGGYTVMADHGFSFIHYVVQAHYALNWPDVFGGIGKTIVCALAIGSIGCMRGIHTGNEPRAVGRSTTGAVVGAILATVAIDGCFGVIYYYMGI